MTYDGVATWDALPHLDRSRWLLQQYGLPASRSVNELSPALKWYGPLWSLVLGVASEVVLAFLHDSMWVQHAINFALLPVGLLALHRLLVRAGVARSTAWLATAQVLGIIRLGGHALVNVNDFPFAMAYLLVALYLWIKLRELHPVAVAAGRYPLPSLAVAGVASIVPYLIRPPVPLHTVVLIVFVGLVSAVGLGRGPAAGRTASAVAVPLAAALGAMWACWPSLWEAGFAGWALWKESFGSFTSFHWVGPVRFFGHTELSNQLPRWYAFVWVPVILHPVTLLVTAAGLVNHVRARRWLPRQSLVVETRFGRVDVTFGRWLLFFTAAAWLGVVLIHPTLYDEERHLLFLFPPVVVLAALGLDELPARVKHLLAAATVAGALVSYAGWGRYAYVYKSPLVGDRAASRFMGDYWGVCVPLAIRSLPEIVPRDAEVSIFDPFDAAAIQYKRLREGLLSRIEGFGPYRLVGRTANPGAYVLTYNRLGATERAFAAARAGKTRILWTTSMPPGEPACVISGPVEAR